MGTKRGTQGMENIILKAHELQSKQLTKRRLVIFTLYWITGKFTILSTTCGSYIYLYTANIPRT